MKQCINCALIVTKERSEERKKNSQQTAVDKRFISKLQWWWWWWRWCSIDAIPFWWIRGRVCDDCAIMMRFRFRFCSLLSLNNVRRAVLLLGFCKIVISTKTSFFRPNTKMNDFSNRHHLDGHFSSRHRPIALVYITQTTIKCTLLYTSYQWDRPME